MDPLVSATTQPYQYADNDPSNHRDPTGLSDDHCTGGESATFDGVDFSVGDELCFDITGPDGTRFVNKMTAVYTSTDILPVTGHIEIQGPDGSEVGNSANSKGGCSGFSIAVNKICSWTETDSIGADVAAGWYHAIFWWHVEPTLYDQLVTVSDYVTGSSLTVTHLPPPHLAGTFTTTSPCASSSRVSLA